MVKTRKRYTSEENWMILKIVLKWVENDVRRREHCRGAYLNAWNYPILEDLKDRIFDRSDDALLIQISIVVCSLFYPETEWGKNHSRSAIYKDLYSQIR